MGEKEKGIIEKLGILSVSRYKCSDYWQNYQICDSDEVEKIEIQKDEMLGALIDIINIDSDTALLKATKKAHDVIVKETGKTWSQIKELL